MGRGHSIEGILAKPVGNIAEEGGAPLFPPHPAFSTDLLIIGNSEDEQKF